MISEIHAEAIAWLDEIDRPSVILRDITDFVVGRESENDRISWTICGQGIIICGYKWLG